MDYSLERQLAARVACGALSVRIATIDLGSAVAVGNRILTAAHVVMPPQRDLWDLETAVFNVGLGRCRFHCRVLAYEETHDVAILESVGSPFPAEISRFTVSSDAHIGDPIWMSGYPFGTDVPVVRRGTISSIVMPEEATIVDRNMFMSARASFPQYWIDVPVFAGNSGGPVFNGAGDLIGLALSTMHGNHPITSAEGELSALKPMPVYMDLGVAVRLDLALPRTGLDQHLA